ncbi:MAG: SGNH/GDSL hydrolase family protein [Verrucomicrobiae bacterium]|nr:SGNH/GDSL hydrolase family protein [Verrucomicrobiae bacterium]
MKPRALLLASFLLLSTIPFPAEGQSPSRNSRKPTASDSGKRSGPLAFLFPGRNSTPAPPPPAAKPKESAVPIVPTIREVGPAVSPTTGELTVIPRRDPRQKRVFILADSQGHTEFGPEFQKQLLMGGYEVLFHAVKNGTPYFWSGMWDSPVLTRIFSPASEPEEAGKWEEVSMRPRAVSDYIEVYDPDIFIFQAGTNFEEDLAKDAPRQISELIGKSVSAASARGAKVLWIGPPDARDDVKSPAFQEDASVTLKGALASLSTKQGADCFFDSRPVCPMPNQASGDGEHPGPSAARDWARSAGAWALASIREFESDKGFRSRKANPIQLRNDSPFESSLTQVSPAESYPMKLRLVSKSRIENPATMAYTDAFSVYKYELENPSDIVGHLKDCTLTKSDRGETAPYQVYVLHWTAHHDGKRAATTRVASWKEGSRVRLRLTPLDQHPLGKALGTMRQCNDFDDFDAPIFVAANLLDERKF